MPEIGKKLPAFQLPNEDGEIVSLDSLKGKWVVLYFYPKDDTPGCTVEACEFSDALTQLKKLDAVVYGVSPDSPSSHKKFIAKKGLKISLLADEGSKVSTAYGIWVEKSMYGKKYMGVARTTFLLSPDGKLAHVFEKVKPQGHAEEVRLKLKELKAAA